MNDWKDHIEKYRRGELSASEMHELEKRALSDPFLADALEGVASVSPSELTADLRELNHSIHRNKQVIFTPLRIAAGIVAVIGVSLYLFLPSRKADVEKQLTENTTRVPDSTLATKPAPDTTQQLALTEEPKKENVIARKKSNQSKPAESTRTETQQAPVAAIVDSDSAIAEELKQTDAVASASLKTTRITGTVSVAEDGLTLPGVTIKVKGTSTGTTTDINGNYSLEVPDNLPLVFSFVGMQTSEVATLDQSTIDVKMKDDASMLSEVVITRSAITRSETEGPILVLAEPAGGMKAYDKYMEDNLVYPQLALDNNVKGRVVIDFAVGLDGALEDFVVKRSLGYGCDDEVIRLVKEGPVWRPTLEDNKPIESRVRVRMRFDPAKAKKKR